MVELELILDFACCICNDPVSVTVRCEGSHAALKGRTVAAVNIPCPHCGSISKLCFEPNGTVRAVLPGTAPRPLPVPSLN